MTATEPRPALTARQADILRWVEGYWLGRLYPPSIREIAEAFGIASPNGVLSQLRALERKGYLVRRERAEGEPSRARTVISTDLAAAIRAAVAGNQRVGG